MADQVKPDAQASTDGKGTLLTNPPAAAAAPADGAKPEGDKPAGTPPAEGKPDGEGKPAEEPGNKDGQAPPAPKAPEKYSLAVPEGAETFVLPEHVAQIEKLARQGDMTNEQAQAALEAFADQAATRRIALAEETKNHPTYGKENFAANEQLARKVIDRFRPTGHPMAEAFRAFLNAEGAGSHIQVFAFLADIGRAMAEDKPPATGAADGARAPRDAATVLYGS